MPGQLIVSFRTTTMNDNGRGSKSVALAAPGDDIRSTHLGSGHKQLSGTSKTVDKLPALSGKTVTGGRIDLGRALGSVG